MVSNIKLQRTRLSLIWFESNPKMLENPTPPAPPMPFLGNRDLYADKFDALRKDGPAQDGLEYPWGTQISHHFWRYYLEKKDLSEAKGSVFWKFLVPFRIGPNLKIWADGYDGRLSHEGYFYGFGFAWLLHFDSNVVMSLRETISSVLNVTKMSFSLRHKNGEKETLGLYALAEKSLVLLRESALGPGAAAGLIKANEPFSIFSVIQSPGPIPKYRPKKGGEIHRLMEALTTWNPALINGWGRVKPPDMDQRILPALKHGTPINSILYAQKRGRVVWFPEAFMDKTKNRTTLSCYHRNLTLLTLQVESLSEFLKTTGKEINEGRWLTLPQMHRDCARNAAGIIGRMYGDVEDTYRSLSPRYHLDQNRSVELINIVRKQCDLHPLS